jgi:hypothetical protein
LDQEIIFHAVPALPFEVAGEIGGPALSGEFVVFFALPAADTPFVVAVENDEGEWSKTGANPPALRELTFVPGQVQSHGLTMGNEVCKSSNRDGEDEAMGISL